MPHSAALNDRIGSESESEEGPGHQLAMALQGMAGNAQAQQYLTVRRLLKNSWYTLAKFPFI